MLQAGLKSALQSVKAAVLLGAARPTLDQDWEKNGESPTPAFLPSHCLSFSSSSFFLPRCPPFSRCLLVHPPAAVPENKSQERARDKIQYNKDFRNKFGQTDVLGLR